MSQLFKKYQLKYQFPDRTNTVDIISIICKPENTHRVKTSAKSIVYFAMSECKITLKSSSLLKVWAL